MRNYSYFLIAITSLLGGVAMTTSTPSLAEEKKTSTPASVTISSMRDPVDKSYRKMLAGMEVFEKNRHLSPNGVLRYKLLPRKHDTVMEGIVLKVIGDSKSIQIPIAADQTFTLSRDAILEKEDASVRPDRRAGSLTWRTEIRTPGLPANVRRLGDLRLECKVGRKAGLISEGVPITSDLARRLTSTTDLCLQSNFGYFLFSDKPLFGVTLIDGNRRYVLPLRDLYAGLSVQDISPYQLSHYDCQVLLDYTYFAPLHDATWSDDTIVELEYMSPNASPKAPDANTRIE